MRTTLGLSTPACDDRSALPGRGARGRPWGRRSAPALLALSIASLGTLRQAHADGASSSAPQPAPQPAAQPAPLLASLGPASEITVGPPPSQHSYVQFGVGLASEVVASPGPICPHVTNCILGSGGGLDVRAGWRPVDRLYLGGAYEVSKQDPNQLYRLGILQQLRAEGRRYFPTGRETSPFVLVGLGASGYGDEWRVDTWGASATVGGGLEVELGAAVVTVSAAYRPMYFQAWSDTSGIPHDAGVAHFLSLEISIEAKDRL